MITRLSSMMFGCTLRDLLASKANCHLSTAKIGLAVGSDVFNHLMTLATGELFESKLSVCAAAITFNNLVGKSHYSRKSCSQQLVLRCSACRQWQEVGDKRKLLHDLSACEFAINANLQKKGGWKIGDCVLSHSCSKSVRSQSYTSSTLSGASGLVQAFAPSGHGDVKQLQAMMKKTEGLDLKYHQVYTLLEDIKGNPTKAPFDQIARLPSLLEALETGDPAGTYELMWEDADNSFQYCFICPSSGIELWNLSRRLLCCDGAHIRSLMKGTLLTATVKDANSHSVLLAMMYCASEDEKHWTIFLREVIKRFDGIELIMSDKDKGGEAAIMNLDKRLSVCLKHVEKNLKTKHAVPIALKKYLWSLGRSATAEESESLTARARMELKDHLKAIDYILSRKSEFCTEDVLGEGHVRFDELTNNTSEVKNRSLKVARGLPVVDMIMRILRRESQLWMEHYAKSLGCQQSITPSAHRMAEKSLAKSLEWKCDVESIVGQSCVALVWIEDRYSYRVRLDPTAVSVCDCRCGKATNRGYPCDHGILVLFHLSKQFPDYAIWSPVSVEWYCSVYHTATWQKQYENPYQVAEFKEAELGSTDLKPWPTAPKGKGRPKEKRFQPKFVRIPKPDSIIRKIPKCTLCKEMGHNRRSCRSRNLRAIAENISHQ
jgi:hypothetical protein